MSDLPIFRNYLILLIQRKTIKYCFFILLIDISGYSKFIENRAYISCRPKLQDSKRLARDTSAVSFSVNLALLTFSLITPALSLMLSARDADIK